MMINRKCIPYNHSRGFRLLAMVFVAIVVVAAGTSCSSTSALKEGEQLFTGLKKIEYTDYEPGGYADSTILEMESVLASAPNGASSAAVIIARLSLFACGFGMLSRSRMAP